jgi:hypothetical protein
MRYRPTPRDLLMAELARARPRADRVAELVGGGIDFDALRVDLEHRRLLPLLGTRLCALGAAPPAFCKAVEQARTAARAFGLARQLETSWVLDTLGVPALPLKGTALAEEAHGDLGMRVGADIDVLVAREDLRGAVGRLQAQGYRVVDDEEPVMHTVLVHPARTPVEVHWRVHWYETQFSRALLANPDAAHTGASLLLIYARDGFGGLRLAADIAAWHDRYGGEGLLDDLAGRYPRLLRTWRAAAQAAEQVVGVPATAWLSDPTGPDLRGRVAVRLANPADRGVREQRAADVLLVDCLLAPRTALPTVIRREVGTAPDGRRATHMAKKTARCVRALAAALASPRISV